MVLGQNIQDNIILGILSIILTCLAIVYYWLGIVKALRKWSFKEVVAKVNDFLLKIKKAPIGAI